MYSINFQRYIYHNVPCLCSDRAGSVTWNYGDSVNLCGMHGSTFCFKPSLQTRELVTLLRSGENYHHSMFHNPTAAVNLFHVGKQYLTLCKAEAAVTRNLIGRKTISNVKHADARNSLPILDRYTLKSQTPQYVRVLHINATSKRQVFVIRVYTCSERHLTF